jgi:hypothetical protein
MVGGNRTGVVSSPDANDCVGGRSLVVVISDAQATSIFLRADINAFISSSYCWLEALVMRSCTGSEGSVKGDERTRQETNHFLASGMHIQEFTFLIL